MQEAFVMLHILEHTLSHTIEDSVKLLPFLFFTYLLMELLEHTTGGKVQNKIKNAGKVGPLWGGLLGIMPQCGFSAKHGQPLCRTSHYGGNAACRIFVHVG